MVAVVYLAIDKTAKTLWVVFILIAMFVKPSVNRAEITTRLMNRREV
ncbi:hypothetical protein PMIT1342_00769 [Prochlorococcus marinus str. MIT 1342]|nr:hypothetical protein PMIT1342_00769 [Prochlorococcus marinus str. MIT 1342]